MTNRRSSIYTIRTASPDIVEEAVRWLTGEAYDPPQVGTPVVDRGDQSVSFRARGDGEAQRVAADAMIGVDDRWTLTTGLGVHRRTVVEA